MMAYLAKIADRGPMVAAGLAAGLLLAALWLPVILGSASPGLLVLSSFLSMYCLICSAAVVAFVALRHGENSTLQVVGVCLLLLIVVSAVLYQSAVRVPMVASVFWLPAIIAALVLARTVKLDYGVLAIVFCGVVAVTGLTLIVGDSERFWRTQLGETTEISDISITDGRAESLERPDVATVGIDEEQREAFIGAMARMMTGAMGVSVMSVALGALFLARSWQAGIVNPGGFQTEFHALSLGKNAALACVGVIAMGIVQGGQLAGAIAMVVIFAFFIQGLAVVHALVKQRGMHRYWLHGIYVLLLLPHTLLLLAALGLADNLFRLRRA